MPSTTIEMLRTEVRLFAREPSSLFWIMAFPAALLGLLAMFLPDFHRPSEDLGGVAPITLYVPVAIILAMLFASVSAIPTVLATYREQRILRRIATTPARPADLLLAQFLVHGAAAVIGGLLAAALAWIVFDASLPGNAIAWILVFALALAACLSIGGVIASAAPSGRTATTIGMVVLFPMMFTAGVWMPVATMPGMLGELVSWTPLGAAALALDAAAAGDWPPLRHVGVALAWTVGLGAAAVRFFRWE